MKRYLIIVTLIVAVLAIAASALFALLKHEPQAPLPSANHSTNQLPTTPNIPAPPPVMEQALSINSASPNAALLERIALLQVCMSQNHCSHISSTPLSDLKQAISDLITEVKKGKSYEDDLPKLARSLLESKLGNGDLTIQKLGLDLMMLLDPAPENIGSLTMSIGNANDIGFIHQHMVELSRYLNMGVSNTLDKFFVAQLKAGDTARAVQISQDLLPFINPENVFMYKRVLEQLAAQNSTPNSELHNALVETLSQYNAAYH